MTAVSGIFGRRLQTPLTILTFCLSLIVINPTDLFGQRKVSANIAIRLIWTATGDDDDRGTASYYDIRYSAEPVGADSESWWRNARKVNLFQKPKTVGQQETCIVYNLPLQDNYYFAIKAADEVLNWSGVSNIVEISGISCADVDGDGAFDYIDIEYLLDFLFGDGPPPVLMGNGDVDNSGEVNVADALYMINFMVNSGPAPECED